MKIALIIYKCMPSKGGGEGYLFNLANQLTGMGHDVHVITNKWEKNNDDNLINFHSIPVIRYPKILKDITFVINVLKEITRNDYDIIQVVGRALGMNVFNPHCGVERAWLRQDFRSIGNPVYKWLKYFFLFFNIRQLFILWLDRKQYNSKKVSRIIAISDMIKNDIIKYHDVDQQKIKVVYNGVDINKFSPKNRKKFRKVIRSELSIGEDFTILYISNNFRLKGLVNLIKSLGELNKKHKNVKAIIIGRGNASPYRKLAKKLDCLENLIFLGHVSGIEKYYVAADIYVHPTFYDSCSLVVTEALASGLPVITTIYDGASGVIDDGVDGFILERPDDYETLAEKIELFFDDDYRQKVSIAAREKAEKYPEERNCDEIVEIYKEVVGNHIDDPTRRKFQTA